MDLICLHHIKQDNKGNYYTPDIDNHLKEVLKQAESQYPGAMNLFPIVRMALKIDIFRVAQTNRPAEEQQRFEYDAVSQSCYLDGDRVLIAFDNFNNMRKSPHFPNIPQPAVLALAIHEAHGYTVNISDRAPDQDPSAIDLMYRYTPDDCDLMHIATSLGKDKYVHGLNDNKGLHTVYVPQRTI